MRIRHLLAPAALALTSAAPAAAHVTSTQITTPDDPLFVLHRTDTEGPAAPSISGTGGRVLLGRPGARALRRHGRLRLTVILSARVPATAAVTGRRSFTIRLPR
jgi:hypothetical protein